MPAATFDAFRAELSAIAQSVSAIRKKTLRDESLRERLRMLFRSWVATVQPAIQPLLGNKREFYKLGAELEALAALTTKFRSVSQYRTRLNRAIELGNKVVLHLPPSDSPPYLHKGAVAGELFLDRIPDLPLNFVPNAVLGWKSKIDKFLQRYPFDRSVFIMIRYRTRNKPLVARIIGTLSRCRYKGILASDHNLTDDLYNPVACLLCCSKGIVVFDEPESEQAFNPNVSYELGMMHLLGRDCCILKHRKLTVLHTDILMKLYLPYTSVDEAAAHVTGWLGGER